jgi:hypothetical protein
MISYVSVHSNLISAYHYQRGGNLLAKTIIEKLGGNLLNVGGIELTWQFVCKLLANVIFMDPSFLDGPFHLSLCPYPLTKMLDLVICLAV